MADDSPAYRGICRKHHYQRYHVQQSDAGKPRKIICKTAKLVAGQVDGYRTAASQSIPVEDGMQIKITGEGHSAMRGGTNGDLLLVINEIPHATLRRDGQNLFYTKIISVMDAMLGCEISVPCLDGNYKVKIDPGTQSGAVVKLRNKGLPAIKGYGSGTGDLYVKILVWIPHRLSKNEKDQLEAMKYSNSFTPDPTREDKAIFDKEKNIF